MGLYRLRTPSQASSYRTVRVAHASSGYCHKDLRDDLLDSGVDTEVVEIETSQTWIDSNLLHWVVPDPPLRDYFQQSCCLSRTCRRSSDSMTPFPMKSGASESGSGTVKMFTHIR